MFFQNSFILATMLSLVIVKILLWTVDKMMSTHEKSFALTTNVAIDTEGGQSILTKLIIIFSL